MVAATRSRVCEAFGVQSPRKCTAAAAAAGLRGFSDQLGTTEKLNACNLFKSIHGDYRKSPDHGNTRRRHLFSEKIPDAKYASRRESRDAWLYARLRSAGKSDSGLKRCRKAPVQLKDASTPDPGADIDQLQLRLQTSQENREGLQIPSLSASPPVRWPSSESVATLPTMKFGMYAGRVKANPLKYLATVLRSKLQPHCEACNLLEVATEIHDEAKNKHNTTLRRIYDVVNVLEAAGLLERSNGSTPFRTLPGSTFPGIRSNRICKTGRPSAENCSFDFIESQGDQVEECSGNQTIHKSKPDLMEKKSARGSRIRWLGSQSGSEERCYKQMLCLLEKEKIAAADRISAKQRELQNLQEEVRLTTELIIHNQNGNDYHHSDYFGSHINPCTPPPSDDQSSCSYLNFEECSQTFADIESSHELIESRTRALATADAGQVPRILASSSLIDGDFDHTSEVKILDPRVINTENLNFWNNQPEAAEHCQSNGLQLGNAVKGLRLPFVVLRANNATNVDIELDGDETSSVYIALDAVYQLFDYRDLLSCLFPRSDDREIHPYAIDTY